MNAEHYEDYGDPEPTLQMGRYTPQPTHRRRRSTYMQPMMNAEQCEDYGDVEPMQQVGRYTPAPAHRRQRPTYVQATPEHHLSYSAGPSFVPPASSPRRSRTAEQASGSLFTMLVCVILGAAIAVACHQQGQQQQQQVEAER